MRETEGRTGTSIRPKPTSTRPEPGSKWPEPDFTRSAPEVVPVEPATDAVYTAPARAAYDDPRGTYDHEPARMTYAEPPLFASSAEPALFAASAAAPRRRTGLSIWFAAAASLVLGIVIGFASGYRAGQGSPAASPAAEAPAPTSGSASPGQPFSESTVSDPVRLDPKEVVPTPSAQPAPATPPVGRTPSGPPGAPESGVAAPSAPRDRVARPTTPPAVAETPRLPGGPGSLQVLSRPAGAEVIVDGRSVGRTPLSIEMSAGRHDVRLALPGFNPWQATVDVKPGSPTRVSGSLEQ